MGLNEEGLAQGRNAADFTRALRWLRGRRRKRWPMGSNWLPGGLLWVERGVVEHTTALGKAIYSRPEGAPRRPEDKIVRVILCSRRRLPGLVVQDDARRGVQGQLAHGERLGSAVHGRAEAVANTAALLAVAALNPAREAAGTAGEKHTLAGRGVALTVGKGQGQGRGGSGPHVKKTCSGRVQSTHTRHSIECPGMLGGLNAKV